METRSIWEICFLIGFTNLRLLLVIMYVSSIKHIIMLSDIYWLKTVYIESKNLVFQDMKQWGISFPFYSFVIFHNKY